MVLFKINQSRKFDHEVMRGARVEGSAFVDWIRTKRFSRADEGQSIVEFAMVLPFFLLVVTGIFTFGIFLSNYIVLTNAVNVGGRQLAISRQQTTDPCATVVTAVTGAAPNLASSSLTYNLTLNGVGASGTSCTSAATNLVENSPATLTVTYPCRLVAYKWSLGSACTLRATVTEEVE